MHLILRRLFIPGAFQERCTTFIESPCMYSRMSEHKYKVGDLASGQETVYEYPTIFWIP